MKDNIFAENSLCDFFWWQVNTWSIPSDDDLDSIEALLAKSVMDIDAHIMIFNTRWHFSAAAELIHYRKFIFTNLVPVLYTYKSRHMPSTKYLTARG